MSIQGSRGSGTDVGLGGFILGETRGGGGTAGEVKFARGPEGTLGARESEKGGI